MNRYGSNDSIEHHVTYHAAERFVERVLGFNKDMLNTSNRIWKVREEIFLQVKLYTGLTGKMKVPLPDYPNYIAVMKDGVVITITEKK